MTSLEKGSSNAAPDASSFKPTKVLEVEIGQPLPAVPSVDAATGETYERALVLVRLHTQPLGVVELHIGEHGLNADECATQIWDTLGSEINEHLTQDGLPEVACLTARGIPGPSDPRCVEGRKKLLEDAPFVTVVVATRDRTDTLAPTLRSLLELEYPSFDILVVDNAPSTSATSDLIAQTYGTTTQVRYVREDRPGLGAAHARSLQEVTAPIVAFTDDDVLLDRYWLAELVRGFSSGPNVGCVTGLVFPAEIETRAQFLFEQYLGLGKGVKPRIFDLRDNRDRSPLFPYSAGWFGTGASMAFKSSAIRDVGGFAPQLGPGSKALNADDLDAFFRIIEGGYQLVYQPAAILWHFHRREYDALRWQIYTYGAGFTAFLTKAILDRPLRLFDIGIRIPIGIYMKLKSKAPRVIRQSEDFPKELLWLERKGMLYGPIGYFRSLLDHWRRTRERSTSQGSPSQRIDVDRMPQISGQLHDPTQPDRR